MRDYYAILGLPRTASAAEIDAAFRSLARKYHPDLRPEEEGKDATARFKLVTEAREVLSNAKKRREYDRDKTARRRVPVSAPLRQLADGSHSRQCGHRGERWTSRRNCVSCPRRQTTGLRWNCVLSTTKRVLPVQKGPAQTARSAKDRG